MKFAQKLAKLTEERDKQKLSLEAGLPPTAVSNYISKDNTPRSDTALKLSRLLNVPLEWLVDDSQEGDPPVVASPKVPVSELSDTELIRELAVRYRRALVDFLNTLEAGAKFDWMRAAEELEKLQPGHPVPDLARRGLALLTSIEAKVGHVMQDFDVSFYTVVNHADLPGSDRTLEELESVSGAWAYGAYTDRADVTRFAQVARSSAHLKEAAQGVRLDYYKDTARRYRHAISAVDHAALIQKANQRFGNPAPPTR